MHEEAAAGGEATPDALMENTAEKSDAKPADAGTAPTAGGATVPGQQEAAESKTAEASPGETGKQPADDTVEIDSEGNLIIKNQD
jgi:hypothetical protein